MYLQNKSFMMKITIFFIITMLNIKVDAQLNDKRIYDYLKGQWSTFEQADAYCLNDDSIGICQDCFCYSWTKYLNDSVVEMINGQKWYYRVDSKLPILYYYSDFERKRLFMQKFYIIQDSITFYEIYPNHIIRNHRIK